MNAYSNIPKHEISFFLPLYLLRQMLSLSNEGMDTHIRRLFDFSVRAFACPASVFPCGHERTGLQQK